MTKTEQRGSSEKKPWRVQAYLKSPPRAILRVTLAVVSVKARLDHSGLPFRSVHNRWRDTALEESPDHIRLRWLLAPFSETLYVILSLFVFYLSEWFIVREMWCQLSLPHHQSCFIKVNSVWLAEISSRGNPRKPLLAVIFSGSKGTKWMQ